MGDTYEAVCIVCDGTLPHDDCRAISALGLRGAFDETVTLPVTRVCDAIANGDEVVIDLETGVEHLCIASDGGARYIRSRAYDTPADPLLSLPECSDTDSMEPRPS